MGKQLQQTSQGSTSKMPMFLDSLEEGSVGPITIMVCRKWDVTNINGRYMSTDFIVSDKKGNVMHCTTRNNIAHCFVEKLQEGGLYSLRGFTVQPNRDEYRILKDNPYLIEFQGSTGVTKVADDVDGFIRHPFELVDFEKLTPTDRKYFVDVIGYVTSVGSPTKKATGAQTLDFNLINDRGRHVRVTLWGALGDELLEKKAQGNDLYAVILTSMSAKYYLGHLCLSSSSSTLIVDSVDVPALQEFTSANSNIEIREANTPIIQILPQVSTIAELLQIARERKKEAVSFTGKIEITNVRTKNSWFNFTCTSGKCRKGVSRKSGNFWCEACDTVVSFPRPRFRLQLDVKDETAGSVIVLFDETVEKLTKTTAKALLAEESAKEGNDAPVLPHVLQNLIGSSHVFEMKSTTYYQFGEYERFNCARVILPVGEELGQEAGWKENSENVHTTASPVLDKSIQHVSTINTPSKKAETKKRKMDDHDLDAETSADNTVSEGDPPFTRKKKRSLYQTIDDSKMVSDNQLEVQDKEGDNVSG